MDAAFRTDSRKEISKICFLWERENMVERNDRIERLKNKTHNLFPGKLRSSMYSQSIEARIIHPPDVPFQKRWISIFRLKRCQTMREQEGRGIFIFHVLNAFEESARCREKRRDSRQFRSTDKKDFFLSFFYPQHQGSFKCTKGRIGIALFPPLVRPQSCLHPPFLVAGPIKSYSTSVSIATSLYHFFPRKTIR